MNTVNMGYFRTSRGRRLVPGGLNVPALDRNQSPLHSPFLLALIMRLPSTAHKGGDPRQELSTSPFLLIYVLPLHPNCAHPALIKSVLHPSISPCLYALCPALPVLPTLPCSPCLARLPLLWSDRSPLLCSAYTTLPFLIVHTSNRCKLPTFPCLI